MGNEAGTISAAEVGRHLAILGSCALAKDNKSKKKNYYLAHEAQLEVSKSNNGIINTDKVFLGFAKTLQMTDRSGIAYAELTTKEGILTHTLTIEYYIIREYLFQRLHRSKRTEYNKRNADLYSVMPILHNLRFLKNTITAKLAILTPEECIGHFDLYPCIPASILIHMLIDLAEQLLAQIVDMKDVRYIVSSYRIKSRKLAFAGDNVLFSSDFIAYEGGDYIFKYIAKNNQGQEFVDVLLKLNKFK